jgi:D-3-phosphoglycerate dehydrogenase / 2-oxoglutarate reductase
MPKPKVVITDYTFPDLDREKHAAEAAGAVFEAHQCKSAEEVAEAVRGASVAVVQFAPADANAVARLAEGAALIRYGIGYDNIDVAAATAHGFPVGYVPDYCPDEVAEHTCAALLAQLRKLSALDASVRAGDWKAVAVAKPMKPFSKTMIGFFGFGQIGKGVHARLKGFGFQFGVADPAVSEEDAALLGLTKFTAEDLFRHADAISLHAPANAATMHFVNAARIAEMKPGAVIINSARGALIDEDALAAALKNGQIAGAALDVFEAEPLPAHSALRDAPGTLLTPHVAWYSDAAIGHLQQLVADDIANHLAGRSLRQPVPGSLQS